ncbi:MAG: cache domain-containing protein [Anaerolineae bacterium]|nr:cache domain-containing protein [Anaerolineae bacterium]
MQEQARIARDFGGGYVYYHIENIGSGSEEPKVSYVLQLDYQGEVAYIGAGLHPQDTHGICPPETVRASLVGNERELEHFVRCAEHHLRQQGLQALHDFNQGERWINGSTYIFLIDFETLFMVASGGQAHLLGTCRTADKYAEGRVKAVPEMQRVLESHDEGYVYYRFRNPATDEEGRKVAFVRRILLDGHAYILGSGLYIQDTGA